MHCSLISSQDGICGEINELSVAVMNIILIRSESPRTRRSHSESDVAEVRGEACKCSANTAGREVISN